MPNQISTSWNWMPKQWLNSDFLDGIFRGELKSKLYRNAAWQHSFKTRAVELVAKTNKTLANLLLVLLPSAALANSVGSQVASAKGSDFKRLMLTVSDTQVSKVTKLYDRLLIHCRSRKAAARGPPCFSLTRSVHGHSMALTVPFTRFGPRCQWNET